MEGEVADTAVLNGSTEPQCSASLLADSHSDVASVSGRSCGSHSHTGPPSLSSKTGSSGDGVRDEGVGGGGVMRGSSIADFDTLRFKNNFLEVIEELRMRRKIDSENEERIKQLLTEKHDLKQLLDEAGGRCSSLMEQHSTQERELQRHCQEQLTLLEEHKAKHTLSIESKVNELKGLKNEIRALHLSKYNLEKRLAEEERQLHLQNTSREAYLSQTGHLELRCAALGRQLEEVLAQMERLDANVCQAQELNQKLRYVNEHQKCELEVCGRELRECRLELVGVRVVTAGRVGSGERGVAKEGSGRSSEQELKMQVELTRQVQAQLLGLREEHQAVLQELRAAHSLVERHAESSSRLRTSQAEVQEQLIELKTNSKVLEEQCSSVRDNYDKLQLQFATEKQALEEKSAETEHRLKTLQLDYSSLQASHDALEQSCAESSRQGESVLAEARRERERLVQELEQVRSTAALQSVCQANLEELRRDNQRLIQELEQARSTAALQSDSLEELRLENQRLGQEVEQNGSTLDDHERVNVGVSAKSEGLRNDQGKLVLLQEELEQACSDVVQSTTENDADASLRREEGRVTEGGLVPAGGQSATSGECSSEESGVKAEAGCGACTRTTSAQEDPGSQRTDSAETSTLEKKKLTTSNGNHPLSGAIPTVPQRSPPELASSSSHSSSPPCSQHGTRAAIPSPPASPLTAFSPEVFPVSADATSPHQDSPPVLPHIDQTKAHTSPSVYVADGIAPTSANVDTPPVRELSTEVSRHSASTLSEVNSTGVVANSSAYFTSPLKETAASLSLPCSQSRGKTTPPLSQTSTRATPPFIISPLFPRNRASLTSQQMPTPPVFKLPAKRSPTNSIEGSPVKKQKLNNSAASEGSMHTSEVLSSGESHEDNLNALTLKLTRITKSPSSSILSISPPVSTKVKSLEIPSAVKHLLVLPERTRDSNPQLVKSFNTDSGGSSAKEMASSQERSQKQPSDNYYCNVINPLKEPSPNPSLPGTSAETAGTFSVVFSDDEEGGGEEEEGGAHGGRMLSSQLNRQIDRVQRFLKMDRLRRPKQLRK